MSAAEVITVVIFAAGIALSGAWGVHIGEEMGRGAALEQACGPCDHEARCGELICTAGKDGWHRE